MNDEEETKALHNLYKDKGLSNFLDMVTSDMDNDKEFTWYIQGRKRDICKPRSKKFIK
tara:strand:- start:16621 stop:16794 length:174 start_codon:yes stop_codon:yes gene_type:complete